MDKLTFGSVFRVVLFAWVSVFLITLVALVVVGAIYFAWLYSVLPIVIAAVIGVGIAWFVWWSSK